MMDLLEQFRVWRMTRRIVRTLAQRNGIETTPQVRADIAREIRTGYRTLQSSADSKPFSFYVTKMERALTAQLPRAPLWGGLHPPVDMISVTPEEFRSAFRSLCPLWPFC